MVPKSTLRGMCPNTEFVLVCIFPHSDSISLRIQYKYVKMQTRKKLRIWTLFTQCSDEIYVSVTIDKYVIIFHLFAILCKRRLCFWKCRKWGNLLKNRHHHTRMLEKARILQSLLNAFYCFLENNRMH